MSRSYPFNDALLDGPPDPAAPTVAFDMEGTLSAGVTWRGMRDYLIAHGRKSEFDRFFRSRVLQLPGYYLGISNKQQFRERWILGIFALFRGTSTADFAKIAEWVVDRELWPQRRQVIIDELQTHQKAGRRVVIVSGLIEPMLRLFAERVGCEAIGTPIKFENDSFSGEVATPFTTGAHKVRHLQAFTGVDGKIYAAYGDTGADIPMLQMGTEATAVYPDRKLRQAALRASWRIIDDET